ncbi:MAG TPA: hypothetical protein DHW42_01085 [Candidatus Marinimicrobia bacterium]|nr:hypothetical protein [Candidatus Neomarinimicrobiota bacterium]
MKISHLSFICLILLTSIALLANLPTPDDQTIYLKSGEKLTGKIIKTDAQTGEISIQTEYGILIVHKDDILEEVITIELKSGDKLKGKILAKSGTTTDLLTDYGILTIANSDIAKIEYGLKDKSDKISEIKEKFSLGSERQIDVFYDPTGYTLDKGVLYVSGLSWGFGITDKFQITSKWSGYFMGNFNLRPKLQLFRFGTYEKEQVFSIGAHVHTRYNPDKYEWLEGKYEFDKGHYDNSSWEWISSNDSTPVYYGGYHKIGSQIDIEDNEKHYDDQYDHIEYDWVNVDQPDPKEFYEVFAAYTFSNARKGNTGRISHTFGAIISKHPDKKELMYKVYYAGGVDIRKNLIMNYEIFYDPYYVEWWNREDGIFGNYDENLSLTKPDKPYISPIHFDVGFIYAFSDRLRFGIHFQPYIFGIYMKF